MMQLKRTFNVILLFTVAVGLAPTATAQTKESVDLPALYQEIDEVIDQSPKFIAERKAKIKVCRDSLLQEANANQRIAFAEQLFQLYRPFRNDSAIQYAQLCISLADSLHRPDISGRYRSLLALQCSNYNMYTESLDQLRLVNKSALDQAGLVDYYNACMHVYGELGAHTQIKGMQRHYFDVQNLYRDSVLMVAKEGSEEFLHLKMDILCATRLFQDALNISNQWFKMVSPNTHESAYAAFYRAQVYSQLENHDQKCYWLGRSAIDDIKCAVMDQASLLFLAEQLAADGDIDRARRYMEFTRDCNTEFCSRVRLYQIDPYISILEKSSQAAEAKATQTLIISGVVIGLLLIVLFIISIRKKKQK